MKINKIKAEQIPELTATLAMGWVKSSSEVWWIQRDIGGVEGCWHKVIKVSAWQPQEDLNQANEALKTWLDKGLYDGHRIYQDVQATGQSPCIRLLESRNEVAGCIHESRSMAICVAVLEAETGEKWEIEE